MNVFYSYAESYECKVISKGCILRPSHTARYDTIRLETRKVKPDSHKNIVKDYRPKTGKDHEILKESV